MDMDDNEDELPRYLINPELALLIARGNDLLARLDAWLPAAPARVDWRQTLACRWRRQSGLGIGMLAPVTTKVVVLVPPLAVNAPVKVVAPMEHRQAQPVSGGGHQKYPGRGD